MSLANETASPEVVKEDRRHVIVVGVDGSPASNAALEWAARQAEFTGCTLEVVATWEWPMSLGFAAIPSEYDPVNDMKEVLRPIVSALATSHPKVAVETRIVEGHPSQVLVEASRGASLLVVGSRGLGEFSGMVIGSTSMHCVTNAHCPVVVLRGHSHKDDR